MLLVASVALLLAACSSGLEEVPELENAAKTKTTEARVSSNRDNAEERKSGLVVNTSTDLELTHDTKRGQQLVGLRFNNVKVPRGADIKDAYIQFKADETDSGYVKVRIRAHDTDDSSGFSQGRNKGISKRSKTSASVSWKIDAWKKRGERGKKQRTPDLDKVVEEVTDRKGWDYGNAMTFIISGNDKNDRRVAESYRGSKSGAPQLVIKYSGGDSSSKSAPVSSGPKVKTGNIDYYISPKGSDSNSGSKKRPWKTLLKAARTVKPGDTVCLRGGTYKGTYQVYAGYDRQAFKRDGKKGKPITIMSCPGERATLDGSRRSYRQYKGVSSPVLLRITGDYYIVKNITFKDSAGRGLFMSGNHNIVDGVISHSNHSDGIYMLGKYNTAMNFKSYNNYSRQNGGDSADGLKMPGGYRNLVKNCTVYNNSDDGVDIWTSKETRVENCTAKNNGRGKSGNGRGFKLGSRETKGRANNVAINNRAEGNIVNFTTNNSEGLMLRNNVSRNARQTGFVITKGNKACNNKSYDRRNYVKYNKGCGNKW